MRRFKKTLCNRAHHCEVNVVRIVPTRFELHKPIQTLERPHNLLLVDKNLFHEWIIPDACHLTDHLKRNIIVGYVVPSEIDEPGGTLAEKLDQLKILDIHGARLEGRRRGCIKGWRRKGRGRASESGAEE